VVSPISLDFGTDIMSLALEIDNSNSSSQTLDWNIEYDQIWISPDVTSGTTTTESTVNVNIDRSGLPAGKYTGIIYITSNGGAQKVSVEMIVPVTKLDIDRMIKQFKDGTATEDDVKSLIDRYQKGQ